MKLFSSNSGSTAISFIPKTQHIDDSWLNHNLLIFSLSFPTFFFFCATAPPRHSIKASFPAELVPRVIGVPRPLGPPFAFGIWGVSRYLLITCHITHTRRCAPHRSIRCCAIRVESSRLKCNASGCEGAEGPGRHETWPKKWAKLLGGGCWGGQKDMKASAAKRNLCK